MPCRHHAGATVPAARKRPRWELADIFRLHGDDFRLVYRPPGHQLRLMSAIERCRTAALGGHLERCDCCGFEKPAYNSCRNRHCPKCQGLDKARWVEDRREDVLPVGYFHVVFTLPHELNALILANKRLLFKFLFGAAAGTLLAFGRNNLGGKAGFITLLHTWDQKLLLHVHLHCLVPAGALAEDGGRWIPAPKKFLFPVRALAAVFRGRYIESLRLAFAAGELIFPGQAASFSTPAAFNGLLAGLYRKPWIVYAKSPFGGPEKVLDYLGRYTHRVAISNDRILAVENGAVAFAFRDRGDRNRRKAMTLPAEEFIRRFLLHALPDAFVRIRHFGFLANRAKKRDLPLCRKLLGLEPRPPQTGRRSNEELLRELTGRDVSRCPRCGCGTMAVVAKLPAISWRPWSEAALRPFAYDSS